MSFTLLTNFVGALVLWTILQDVSLPQLLLFYAFLSGILLTITFITYFYLLELHSAHKVVPLFLLSSVWMLVIEISFGRFISLSGLLGIVLLLLGAYVLDTGTLRWQIPKKLLFLSLPMTLGWALVLLIMRYIAASHDVFIASFWQFTSLGIIGLFLIFVVPSYKRGFLTRVKMQGKNFLGFSTLNEALAQAAYFSGYAAVAFAPVAAYVAAMGGLQGLFLLGLLVLFPIHKDRSHISRLQFFAIILMALGTVLIKIA